ncbi:uncharacterized protein ACIB01_014143 [Guaruba guarouba]
MERELRSSQPGAVVERGLTEGAHSIPASSLDLCTGGSDAGTRKREFTVVWSVLKVYVDILKQRPTVWGRRKNNVKPQFEGGRSGRRGTGSCLPSPGAAEGREPSGETPRHCDELLGPPAVPCSSSSSPSRGKKPSEAREKAAPARSGMLLPDGTCYCCPPHFPFVTRAPFWGIQCRIFWGAMLWLSPAPRGAPVGAAAVPALAAPCCSRPKMSWARFAGEPDPDLAVTVGAIIGSRFACQWHPPPSGRFKQGPALPSSILGPNHSSRIGSGARKAVHREPGGERGPRPVGILVPAAERGPGGELCLQRDGSCRPQTAINRGLTGFLQTPNHTAAPDRCGPGCRGWK